MKMLEILLFYSEKQFNYLECGFIFSYAANHILLLKTVAMVSGLQNNIYVLWQHMGRFTFTLQRQN